MAKSKKVAEVEQVLLDLNTSEDVALEHMLEGRITKDQYLEWQRFKAEVASKKGSSKKGGKERRTTCEITRAEFQKSAKPITISIDGKEYVGTVKMFGTGSFGWFLTGKGEVTVGGKSVTVQLSVNLPIVHSKEQTT